MNRQMRQILPGEAALIAPLFDAYRQFYKQSPDLEGARRFLTERLGRDESVVFGVIENGRAIGFAQLYPSFSSVSMTFVWILNDLFVVPEARRLGVATALLRAVREFAKTRGAGRLVLSTAVDNKSAQALYEREGWQIDSGFLQYTLEV